MEVQDYYLFFVSLLIEIYGGSLLYIDTLRELTESSSARKLGDDPSNDTKGRGFGPSDDPPTPSYPADLPNKWVATVEAALE